MRLKIYKIKITILGIGKFGHYKIKLFLIKERV